MARKYLSRLGAVLIAFFLLSSCAKTGTGQFSLPDSAPLKAGDSVESTAQAGLLGETDRLRLSGSGSGLQIEDKLTQASWHTTLDEATLSQQKLNKLWKTTAESMINISYSKTAQSVQITDTNPAMEAEIECYRLKNGIKFYYDFTEVKIKLSLELYIEDNQLVARIPASEIEEYGTAVLMSVELMQFMGAAANDEKGYYLYPDGSGAIFEFSKLDDKKLSTRQYTWPVYGDEKDYLSQNDFQLSDDGKFFLPVFGVKKGENGFVAVITQGAEDANINLYTSAMAVQLNRICAEFTFRRTYDTKISTMENGEKTDTEFTRIDNQLLAYDREVRYLFLEGEGNYSDMANACREYFLEQGILSENLKENSEMPLGIDFFIGTQKESLIPEFVLMSSFDACQQMLSEMNQKGMSYVQTTLEGWNQGGYGAYPTQSGINGKAGGKSGLKKLSRYLEENNGELFLNANYLDVSKDGKGYSAKKDLVRGQAQTVIENTDGTRYLFTPAVVLERMKKTVKKLDFSIAGLSFEGFGSTLYADYFSSNRILRQHTAGVWAQMLSDTKQQFGSAGVYGGNLFLLAQAGRLYDIPSEDSGFSIADESVPFYQMVVHGSLFYSAEPINLLHDKEQQILKMLEYGYIPYYKLTWENSNLLKETKYNTLFTSCYADYKDEIAANYQRFQDKIGDCYTAAMIRHEQVAEDVYRVAYDNGVSLLFNYRSEPVTVGDASVPALDCIRIQGGENA